MDRRACRQALRQAGRLVGKWAGRQAGKQAASGRAVFTATALRVGASSQARRKPEQAGMQA